MNWKDIIILCVATPLFVAAVLGVLWLALEYLPTNSGQHQRPPSVACSEEDYSGLCGVRKFFNSER